MDKRTFLKVSALTSAGLMVSPFTACNNPTEKEGDETMTAAFELPALGYAFAALEPHIDAQTMEIHHDKHHGGYVRKLNNALKGSTFEKMDLNEIMAKVTEDDTAIRNNGGGHYNHSLFWKVMGPNGGGEPTGALADALMGTFESYDAFKEQFSSAAGSVFGSGWAWLCVSDDNKLFITTTPNQDNPMMKNLVEAPGTPILGIDVWEHAYYLKYQNRRGEYVGNFFNVINWEAVAENFSKAG